jgi:hypothetical protein
MAPQQYSFAASIWALVKPRWVRRSNFGESRSAAFAPSVPVQNASPSDHLLKANLMSKALPRPASSLAMISVVKPFFVRLS